MQGQLAQAISPRAGQQQLVCQTLKAQPVAHVDPSATSIERPLGRSTSTST